MASMISKGITLYTAGTPNGWKVSTLLAELKYKHKVVAVALNGEQKEEWFLKISPNGRIPAIACMMYIAEKADKMFPQEWDKKYDVVQWLMWQMAGLGPMQGQANHFVRMAPEKILYGMTRYTDETRRLYGVLDKRLATRDWIAAGEFTIADLACFCWVIAGPFAGISVAEFPHLDAWMHKIYAREAVKEGLRVPKGEFMLEAQYSDDAEMQKMLGVAKANMEEARKIKEEASK